MTAAEPLTFLDPETTEQLRPPCDFRRDDGAPCPNPARWIVFRLECLACGACWRAVLSCDETLSRITRPVPFACHRCNSRSVLGFDRIEPLQ